MAVSRWLPAAVLALLPAHALAQTSLTLERAVQTALAQNASLAAAKASVDEADARRGETRAAFFPRVSITESWQRGDQPVFVFSSLLSARQFAAENFAVAALNRPDALGFFQTGVAVDHVIFDGGRRQSAARVHARRHEMAVATLDEASAAVVGATTAAFGRIVSARAAARASTAALASAREDLVRAERRRDEGMATDADVLALVVHVAEVQQRAIQADGEAEIARAELNRLMGTPVTNDQLIVEPAPAILAALPEGTPIGALLAEADGSRPELRRAAAAVQTADETSRQARALLMPQVALQGAVEFNGTRFADRATAWIAGGELRWTFSTGGAEAAARKAAAAASVRARAEADSVRASVHVDVVSAVSRVATARAREAAGRAAVEQARESQRITRDRFEAGLASVNDVLRAATVLLDAERNRTSALVDLMVADATLRQALGRRP